MAISATPLSKICSPNSLDLGLDLPAPRDVQAGVVDNLWLGCFASEDDIGWQILRFTVEFVSDFKSQGGSSLGGNPKNKQLFE